MNSKLPFQKTITAGAIAAVCSVIINVIIFYIFQSAGVLTDTIFVQPNQPLTVLLVILASIIPSLVGPCVFFLIEKYSQNGFKIFMITSLVLLILSFANPFLGIPEVTISYAMVLNLMHVVVAASLLFFINNAKK